MSSATSIKGGVRLQPDQRKVPLKPDATTDSGFRPWHFFLLASLMTATVAVVLSKQATPEHLILLSIIIAATGLAAAAFYRMLAPIASDDAIFSEPLTERGRAALEREKALVLRSIKELEFDRAMGKVAPRDFDEMAGRLRARAIALMKQLDAGGNAAYREIIERELQSRLAKGATAAKRAAGAAGAGATGAGGRGAAGAGVADTRDAGPASASVIGACVKCGTVNDADAVFCKGCGAKLTEAAGKR